MIKRVFTLLASLSIFLCEEEIFREQAPVKGPPLLVLNAYYDQLLSKIKKTKDGLFDIKLLHIVPSKDLWTLAFLFENKSNGIIEFIGIEVLNL